MNRDNAKVVVYDPDSSRNEVSNGEMNKTNIGFFEPGQVDDSVNYEKELKVKKPKTQYKSSEMIGKRQNTEWNANYEEDRSPMNQGFAKSKIKTERRRSDFPHQLPVLNEADIIEEIEK